MERRSGDSPALSHLGGGRHDGRMTTLIPHWIDGKAHPGGDEGRTGDVTNPATGRVTGRVAFAGPEEIEAAVASARKVSTGRGSR